MWCCRHRTLLLDPLSRRHTLPLLHFHRWRCTHRLMWCCRHRTLLLDPLSRRHTLPLLHFHRWRCTHRLTWCCRRRTLLLGPPSRRHTLPLLRFHRWRCTHRLTWCCRRRTPLLPPPPHPHTVHPRWWTTGRTPTPPPTATDSAKKEIQTTSLFGLQTDISLFIFILRPLFLGSQLLSISPQSTHSLR